ncbi:hypothetical protein CH340_25950, partial [Rhodoplanes serenus]
AALSRTVGADLAALQARAVGSSGSLADDVAAVRSGFDTYVGHVATLARSRTRLGLDENAGLEGTLRKAVQSIEREVATFDQ